MTSDASLIPWMVAILASLIGAGCDLRWRRLPNALTFPVFIAGFCWAGVVNGLPGLQQAVSGCLILAAPYVLLFVFAGGGAGDAKMMGALGAWLGWMPGVRVLVAVLLCGVILGLAYAWVARRLGGLAKNLTGIILASWAVIFFRDLRSAANRLPPVSTQQKMPYGLAIFAGVCLAAGVQFLWPS